MPKCQCCNQDCALINSIYCEECANMVIECAADYDPKLIDETSDYVKNINEGK
jgi:hypothetical protein